MTESSLFLTFPSCSCEAISYSERKIVDMMITFGEYVGAAAYRVLPWSNEHDKEEYIKARDKMRRRIPKEIRDKMRSSIKRRGLSSLDNNIYGRDLK